MSKKPNNQPYISDDPDQIAEAKTKAKIQSNQIKDDIKALMQIPAFRRFVWWLLESSHIFGTSFTGNSETFFREGERNIGLKVFLRVQEHDPEGYLVMSKENSNKENSNGDK